MNYLLDTNAVIYLHKGLLAKPLPVGRHFISVITEIELLSFPTLTTDQERAVQELLADVPVIGINEDVKREAIRLRREHRFRVPDAIIVATALCLDAELISNDTALTTVPDLKVRPVHLK